MAILDSNKVTGVSNVSDPNDAANKFYVDNKAASSLYPNLTSSDSNKFLGVSLEAWTKRTSGLFNQSGIIDAVYAPGKTDSYAVLSRDVLITSTDTISWRKRTTGFADINVYQRSVAHGSVYVLGGYSYSSTIGGWYGALMTSTDGIRWTHRTTPFSDPSNRIYTVRYLNDLYIATGGYTSTSNAAATKVAVSTDAIVWLSRTTGWLPFSYFYGSGEIPYYYNVSYANGIYVVSGFPDISVITSTDTIHWQTRTTGLSPSTSSSSYFYGSAASSSIGNSYVLTKETEGMIISSTDSIVWTFRTSGTGNTGFHDHGIVYNNQYIFAGGNEGNTYGHINISSDAIHWSVRTLPGSTDFLTGITETEEGSILVCSYYPSNTINLYSFPARSWEYAKGTQEYTSGLHTFNVPSKANQLYVELIGGGGGGSGPSAISAGSGGGGGAYISGIIRRSELGGASTLSIQVGSGGFGRSGNGDSGGYSEISFGGYSWRAGGGGGGSRGGAGGDGGLVLGHDSNIINSLGFISVAGGDGMTAEYSLGGGPGVSTFPVLPNQITGGASGGRDGNGGNVTSYYYGNTHISIGGTSGSIGGQSGISTSLTGSYGSGGAGGYSDTSTTTHGDGGDGTGGGGGGGAGFGGGYGGTGGDGYVKIVWW